MSNWLLPSLSDIFRRAADQVSGLSVPDASPCPETLPGNFPLPGQKHQTSIALQQVQAEFEWRAALTAVQDLIKARLDDNAGDSPKTDTSQGVVLCGPLPVMSDPVLSDRLASWIFVSDTLNSPLGLSLQLNPQGNHCPGLTATPVTSVPVLEKDPLAAEQFCLVLTPDFGVVLVLGQDERPCFQFSFDPKVIQMCWQALLLRVRLSNASYATKLHRLFEIFSPGTPDYHLVSEFSRRWTQQLAHQLMQNQLELAADLAGAHPATKTPQTSPSNKTHRRHRNRSKTTKPAPNSSKPLASDISDELAEEAQDVALLKAIAHEVRTPLATIRTLTRLLLRRKDLAPDVLRRLGIIDNECTEQIDRFSLIFRAAEMGPQPQTGESFLAAIPLDQVIQEGLPRWKNQAERRNLQLNVALPEQLPCVVSDPQMLDQALTGLIDRFTRQLPAQSNLGLQVSLAGDQLKLQFQAHDRAGKPITATIADGGCAGQSPAKSLGQLLSFQPATGSLSLNLAVTKNIFQALGGKLLIKERPQQGEVVTVFLPLQPETNHR